VEKQEGSGIDQGRGIPENRSHSSSGEWGNLDSDIIQEAIECIMNMSEHFGCHARVNADEKGIGGYKVGIQKRADNSVLNV